MYRLLTLLLTALLPLCALAAPGDLDTSFGGGDGWASTGFVGDSLGEGKDIIQQIDGKLVVAGYSHNGRNNDFALTRYNSDGSLDTTFSGDGKLITAVAGGDDSANSVIQQTDGKLVAAGYGYASGKTQFALVRYNSNGSLDTSFSGDGKLTTALGAGNDRTYSVIQQADGKLVVAGFSYSYTSNNDFALARYNLDGSLDTSFDGDGMLTTVMALTEDRAYSVIQQADGKLVAAGSSSTGNKNDFALVRYNADGSLDTTFDGDGKLTIAVGAYTDVAYSVIQQADGKLVVAGSSHNGSSTNFALVRYNTDGTLDISFDGDGKLTTAVGTGSDQAYSLIQLADGKLVAAGYSGYATGHYQVSLVRYNSNGSLDTSFSDDGKATMLTGDDSNMYSVIQQTDGKLVVAGSASSWTNHDEFALARYNLNGSLDTTFSGDGRTTTEVYFFSTDNGRSIIQQADGKLVVGGDSYNSHSINFALARYSANGSLDTTFDGDGKLTTAFGSYDAFAYSTIQQADGKLVAAGYNFTGSSRDFALVRYNSNGSLDTTFDGDGKLTTGFGAIGNGDDDYGYSVIQQADGKLVAAGNSGGAFALARYNSNGSLDTSFDGDGKLTTAVGTSYDSANSLIQQADGKLVAAGSTTSGGYKHFALVRYNANGSLDISFDGDGKLTTAVGTRDYANSVIQQADGKLVAAGVSDYKFVLVRFNSNGSLDTTFDGDGKLTVSTISEAYSVIQQADGKLVASGRSSTGINDDFALVRFNLDGSLDTTFDGDGKLTKAFGSGNENAYAVIQQADGKLVVAGYATDMPTGQEFVVARFESGQLDTDADGVVDWLDTDNDGDGTLNGSDAFPLNPAEWLDTDNDGSGNNADLDDDGDGVPDYIDAEPLNAANSNERTLPLDNSYKGSTVQDNAAVD